MRLILLSVVLIGASVASSQTRPAANPATHNNRTAATDTARSSPSARRAQAAMSDAQLETAIRERFAKSKIAADQFQVRVRGGVATLEGRTDVLQHKGVATRLAKSAGAAQVVNRIQPSAAARQKALANLAKARRARVKHEEPGAARR